MAVCQAQCKAANNTPTDIVGHWRYDKRVEKESKKEKTNIETKSQEEETEYRGERERKEDNVLICFCRGLEISGGFIKNEWRLEIGTTNATLYYPSGAAVYVICLLLLFVFVVFVLLLLYLFLFLFLFMF